MALGLTQPLREICTRYLPGGKGRPAHKADNLSSHKPMGLHSLLQGELYLFLFFLLLYSLIKPDEVRAGTLTHVSDNMN
jgi:hypothetical protein